MKQAKTWIAWLLCLSLLLGLSGCGQVADFSAYPKAQSEDDSTWQMVTELDTQPVVLENGRVRFSLDPLTTHFSVTDLQTGRLYHSVPTDNAPSFSDEDTKRMQSEVSVTYFEERSNALYMYSGADSVDNGNFKITYTDNAVRVVYTLGAVAGELMVPQVLDVNTYDTAILGVLDNPNIARRLGRYYTLYDPEQADDTEDFADKVKQYPALKKTALYILNDSLTETENEEISDYMAEAGYTLESYQATLERLGIESTEEKLPEGFVIPVEYRLTEDGFSASVLADGVKQNSPDYMLQTLSFLEYFGSTAAGVKGQYLVADGSGALIDLDTDSTTNFSQAFYGTDYAINEEKRDQLSKTIGLPIYGMRFDDGGLLAIVESGAEVGTLEVQTVHNAAPHNHIFVNFTMRHMDATDVGEDMQIPVYNLFSGHLLHTSPTIRYVLLAPEEATYAGMATYYREYLTQTGQLTDQTDNAAPVYLDYLCLMTEKANFLGINYKKKIVLSTVEEITASVNTLLQAGVQPLVVRLKGYGPTGLEKRVNNTFAIDSRVGTADQLQELQNLLEKYGGRLVLDADFQFAYVKGNGFTAKDDAAHYLNRSLVRKEAYDVVTRDYSLDTDEALSRYYISPLRYQEYADSFIQSLSKKLTIQPGLSYGTAGLYLGGDYTSRVDMDRSMSLFRLRQALDSAKAKNDYLLFDYGNAYVLPYASAVMDAPLYSSKFDIASQEVPLYAMVLHGCVPYAGTAQNLSVNGAHNFLRTVEYGASLAFTLITREDNLLTGTPYETLLYSVSDTERLDTVIAMNQQYAPLWESTVKATMTDHLEVAADVYKTVYSNGHGVYVNYTQQPVTVEDVLVPAMSFTAF